MAGCGCGHEEMVAGSDQGSAGQRRDLIILLLINAVMFVVELAAGWIAQSAGLVADSLDMFADAAVYGIALYAVARSANLKITAARLSGLFQMILALTVLLEVGRRVLVGSEPESPLMIAIGLLALAANVACLLLIARHRKGEVHMRASWIFSANDVMANVAVIASGFLVAWLDSRWPDLVVGLAIAVLVFYGGRRILVEAETERSRCSVAGSGT
ncbi:MAG: cation transporter [Gammaproteobacteria bacterium]|nr:cation transporter [Gammaproteobacteria bacterium]